MKNYHKNIQKIIKNEECCLIYDKFFIKKFVLFYLKKLLLLLIENYFSVKKHICFEFKIIQ